MAVIDPAILGERIVFFNEKANLCAKVITGSNFRR